MIGFVFFLLVMVIVVGNISAAMKLSKQKVEKDDKGEDFIVDDTPKFCPPHKWRYQEVRNSEGVTVKWKLICDICGPLKPSNGPARME
jgi:hypothetical protein